MNRSATGDGGPLRSYETLGVRVDGVQIPDVVSLMAQAIQEKAPPGYISVTGMHGIVEAQDDPDFRDVLNASSLVVPDGMPLVWLARRNGIPLARRVYGPELLETFCQTTGSRFRHFFYGGGPGLADRLAKKLKERHDIVVAGVFSPPFRSMTSAESDDVVRLINGCEPNVVWVGLSTPKQEKWMRTYCQRLDATWCVGVGAAFDFLAGEKKQAPAWMRERGLEWLFRLVQEPRRLWRRYLAGGTRFAYLEARELLTTSAARRRLRMTSQDDEKR